MPSPLGRWWSRVLDIISPRQCVVCGRRLSVDERSLCTVCLLHVPRLNIQFTADDNDMARLFWGLVPIERATAFLAYEPRSEMAQLVYRLKYGNRPDIGEDLGHLMAYELQYGGFFDGIDLLLPVPLAPKRLRQRGYNQSACIAQGISDVTAIPVADGLLRRRHFRESQTVLSRHQRQSNVSGEFYVVHGERLTGQHVLLVDDVCTTGATLAASAAALQGVKNVKISLLSFGLTKK